MLDGGGSSQCDFGGERITASRKVHNWICVYLKQAEQLLFGELAAALEIPYEAVQPYIADRIAAVHS